MTDLQTQHFNTAMSQSTKAIEGSFCNNPAVPPENGAEGEASVKRWQTGWIHVHYLTKMTNYRHMPRVGHSVDTVAVAKGNMRDTYGVANHDCI